MTGLPRVRSLPAAEGPGLSQRAFGALLGATLGHTHTTASDRRTGGEVTEGPGLGQRAFGTLLGAALG